MAFTVRDLATQALREINVVAARETPSAADAEDARVALNDILDQYAAERLAIFTITRSTAAVGGSNQTFIIGVGGTITRQPPVWIDHINALDTSVTPNIEYPMTELTDDAYAEYRQKGMTTSGFPQYWYQRRELIAVAGALRLMVTVFPLPTNNYTVVVYAPEAVTVFNSLSDDLILPPGYKRMLVTNLAVELARQHSRNVTPELMQAATQSKAVVKAANQTLSDMSFDGALMGNGGGWDIRTGP